LSNPDLGIRWIGLLSPPERTPAGYRIYDPAVVDRLQFIQGAQRLGLTLIDIKNVSGAPARGERVAKYNRLLEIADSDPNLGYGLPNAS
jgi:DNA-binding transcriptional MerR regulator